MVLASFTLQFSWFCLLQLLLYPSFGGKMAHNHIQRKVENLTEEKEWLSQKSWQDFSYISVA